MAKGGHAWAVAELLKRPLLLPEAEQYLSAWRLLSRDRPTEAISLGLAGGLTLPRPIPRETIRREGERLGYDGEELDDFTDALTLLDDHWVERTVRREAAAAKAAANRARTKR